MARAKRTDRTEARRRHRAEQAALVEPEPGGDAVATPRASTKAGPKPAPVARPGIVASLKGAYRPLDLRADLRATPQILTNLGFLVAVGITVAAAGWFVLAYQEAMSAIPVGTATVSQLEAVVGKNTIPYFLGTMALQPPPIIGAFLIGFMAKRGSWLGGLVYGIFVVIVAFVVLQTPSGRLLTGDKSADAVIIGHVAWSPIGSAILASLAAWYRRFLDMANPNRGQRGQSKPSKDQGRGDMKPVRR